MIQRLCTQWMEPQELRQMLGDEAYFAAKKLEEEDREADRRFQIFDQFYQIYGDQLDAERMAERWKLTMAHQAFGVEKRALRAENAKLEQEKEIATEKAKKAEEKVKKAEEKANLMLKKAEEKAKKEQALMLKKLEEKTKKEQALMLKKLEEKTKKENIVLLKAEKEKQEQLLKAEKEKQEQLLKAETQKERLKIVQKMLDKGNSVETIADLLDTSVEQVQQWIKILPK